ncbi:flagellar protein FlgN [Wukongibacter baidiensis]|uniref:flagellar protein FlgN n=1 Tax=Wukongibacter baidiensis TaxID=1723361 RepID=UPI003D7F8400
MSKSVEQLMIALNKEYEMYQDVLEIARKKRNVIIEGKIKELDGITGEEQAMIISIGKLENIRESIIRNIVKEMNVSDIKNISMLAEHLDDKTKNEILAIRDKFSEVLKMVKEENDLNSKLIEQSLEYIEFNKNILTTLENRGSTYGSDADERDVNIKSNLFDAKI